MEHNNFKLCGGTLFALLTNAKLKRKRSTFDKKGFSEEDLVKRITELDEARKQKKKALEDGEKPEQVLCPYCHVPLQNNGKIADRCIYCGHEIITSPFK